MFIGCRFSFKKTLDISVAASFTLSRLSVVIASDFRRGLSRPASNVVKVLGPDELLASFTVSTLQALVLFVIGDC